MQRFRAVARHWYRLPSSLRPGQRRWWIVAIAGWWLSPLTAWNDAFTNIPLALGIVWLLRLSGVPLEPKAASVTAYILTNVVGTVLLWIGVVKLDLPSPGKARPWRFLRAAMRTAIYAALVWLAVRTIQGVF